MSKRVFVVSPDYIPKQFLEWHRLKMALQTDLEERIDLQMPASHDDYMHIITKERPDLIFASPFDAGWLMAEYAYSALAKPAQHADEVVIFSHRNSGIEHIRDLKPGMKLAAMANQGVEMIGLRLLEAANLNKDALDWQSYDYFQAVVRLVRNGEVNAGLILASVYNDLSPSIGTSLQVVIKSALEDIAHVFLVRDDDPDLYQRLNDIFVKSRRQTRYYAILREINCRRGFDMMDEEDGLFLADVLETLKD